MNLSWLDEVTLREKKPDPLPDALRCYYCGVKLYYKLPAPHWLCSRCGGSGKGLRRSDGECYRCHGTGKARIWSGSESRPDRYSQDHIIPTSRGGGDGMDNIVDCCWTCNTSKGDRTLEEFRRCWSIRNPLGKLHDELAQWEMSNQIDESDRATIAACRASLSPPPTVKFYGELSQSVECIQNEYKVNTK